MKRSLYIIGIVLIVTSFLASVVSYYLLPFSVPVFTLGVILIWIFGSSFTTKLLLSIIPLLLYMPSTVAFLYLYNYSPTKLILLPQNFEGRFRIVYGEPYGQPYDVYDGMKTIHVESTGIVLMREKFDRRLNFKYSFAGEETSDIRVLLNLADTVKHDVAILLGSSGVHYVERLVDKEANEVDFRYSDFFLYRKGLTINLVDETVDSLTISTIRNCKNQINPK